MEYKFDLIWHSCAYWLVVAVIGRKLLRVSHEAVLHIITLNATLWAFHQSVSFINHTVNTSKLLHMLLLKLPHLLIQPSGSTAVHSWLW